MVAWEDLQLCVQIWCQSTATRHGGHLHVRCVCRPKHSQSISRSKDARFVLKPSGPKVRVYQLGISDHGSGFGESGHAHHTFPKRFYPHSQPDPFGVVDEPRDPHSSLELNGTAADAVSVDADFFIVNHE